MIIKTFNSFNEDLKKIWYECCVNSNSTIFQDYEWLLHWHATFSDYLKTKLCIIVIYKNDNVISILPLCINNRNKVNVLEWIGIGVSDYLQPIVKNKEIITKYDYDFIFNKLVKEYKYIDLIQLTNLPEKVGSYENCLVKSYNCKKISSSYKINIDSNFNDYIKKNKSINKSVKDLIRLENNFNKKSPIKYVEYKNYEMRHAATNEMISLKEKQYNTTGVNNIFVNKLFKNFYLGLLLLNNFQEKIHVSSLTFENNIVAVHFGLKDQLNYYYLMPAYNEKWKKSSPGGILMKKIIEKSFEHKFKKFDFLPGNEKYKIKWSNNKVNIYEYITPISTKGFFIYLLINIKKLFKKSLFLKKVVYFTKSKYKSFKALI